MNSRTLTTLQLSVEKRLAAPRGFKDAGATIQPPTPEPEDLQDPNHVESTPSGIYVASDIKYRARRKKSEMVVIRDAITEILSNDNPQTVRHEREIVDRHRALGVHAERYPLLGASRFGGSGHDADVYLFGRERAPVVAEVKGRSDGTGFAMLERWLGEFDALFLRRNHADALIVLPWRMWVRILERVRP
jgi:hypothetical protein